MILASALTFGIANAKNDEYKHDNCYNYMRGLEAVQNEDNDEAIKYLKAEVEQHPNCDRAYQQLAVIYGNQGENGDALTCIDLAIKHCPKKDTYNQSYNHYVKAKIIENLGSIENAEAEYNKSIKLDPENCDRYVSRGDFYYNRQLFETAAADYKKATELQPGLAISFTRMGMCMEALDRIQEAYDCYDYALKLSPGDNTVIAYKGDALLKLKKYNDAINCYIEAISGDNDNEAALNGLASAIEEAPDALIAKLRAQRLKNPKEEIWTVILATTLKIKQEYDEAIALFKELQKDDQSTDYYSSIAECYQLAGNYPLAIKYIEKAIENEPENYEHVFNKANYLYKMGQYDKAIEAANMCIEEYPDKGAFYAFRSTLQMGKKDYEKAYADVNTAINLGEDNTDSRFLRARALLFLGRNDEAVADLNVVLADTADAYHHAFAEFFMGNKEAALQQFDTLASKSSDDTYKLYNLACAYALMNEKDKALKLLEQCFETGFYAFTQARNDVDFDNIRETPEFNALITKYEERLQKKLESMKDNEDADQYEEVTCEVPYTKKGGITQVKCEVNGLPLHFIFDTGASTISISSIEALFMLKNEYLSEKDIVGSSYYSDANGEISEGTVINLKEVKIGDAIINNVRASVVHNQKAPLLLGQSAFQKFGKMEIDNDKKVVTITYKKKK